MIDCTLSTPAWHILIVMTGLTAMFSDGFGEEHVIEGLARTWSSSWIPMQKCLQT